MSDLSSLNEARYLLREACDLLSAEAEALKSGIRVGPDGSLSGAPEDAPAREAIAEIEGWIGRVNRLLGRQ